MFRFVWFRCFTGYLFVCLYEKFTKRKSTIMFPFFFVSKSNKNRSIKMNQNLDVGIGFGLYCVWFAHVRKKRAIVFFFDEFRFALLCLYYCFMTWLASHFARCSYTSSHLHFNKCFICLVLYACAALFLSFFLLPFLGVCVLLFHLFPGCYCLDSFRFMRRALAGIHKNIM